MAEALDDILTAEEVAQLLAFHPEYVRELARQAKIPARKIGQRWRFSRAQIIRWVEGKEEPVSHV